MSATPCPNTLFQYWHSPEPPPEIAALLESFRQCNPDLVQRVYHRESALAQLAQEFPAAVCDTFSRCAVPAMQADYFRLLMLHRHGGYYADADWLCLQALSGLSQRADGSASDAVLIRRENDTVINGFLYFRQPGHPLLEFWLEQVQWALEERVEAGVWLVTGPGPLAILTEAQRVGAADPQRISPESYDPASPNFAPPGSHERRWIEAACARLGSAHRAQALLASVHLHSWDHLHHFVAEPPTLAYKQGPTHWLHWPGSLYLNTTQSQKEGPVSCADTGPGAGVAPQADPTEQEATGLAR